MKSAQWRSEGHKGALPPPLMQEAELPPFYRRDIGEEMAQQVAMEDEAGRGRRNKAEVRYTDGLTDDQWIMAMDNSDDDVEDASNRKRQRADKKAERKKVNDMLAQAEAEGKPLQIKSLPSVDSPPPPPPPPSTQTKKKRGRPSKSATPSVLGDEGPSVSLRMLIDEQIKLMVEQKKRKVELDGPSIADVSLMWKLYNETNALKTEVGEDLNQYFLKPVDKKVSRLSLPSGSRVLDLIRLLSLGILRLLPGHQAAHDHEPDQAADRERPVLHPPSVPPRYASDMGQCADVQRRGELGVRCRGGYAGVFR